MGGGRDNSGAVRYYRRNGIYFRKDGKPVNHRFRNINITIEDHMALVNLAEPITPTIRAAMNPLPQTGKEVPDFVQRTLSISNLNDGDKVKPEDRNASEATDLYNRLINGDIETDNGGFIYLDGRWKNSRFFNEPNMPEWKEALNQIIPQLTQENLREIITGDEISTIDGVQEQGKLYVFEASVTKTTGGHKKAYVKFYAMHSNEGKPYMVLVSFHAKTGRIDNVATPEERG